MEDDNMPAFANPFQGNVERKLTKEELIQAVRLDIAGELEAIYLYDAHVQATDNEIAKKVISDIRDEEKAHVGELMTLLRILDPQEAEHFISGEQEVKEMLAELEASAKTKEHTEVAKTADTIGSLIK
jgi:rubrerythrin